jgi:hypothetical protein
MREDQIQRYGRQILLREVGGRGQQRLLDRGVHVTVDAPGVAEAIAYLVGGGSPVTTSVRSGGFLSGTTLEALNPDATASAERFLTVSGSVEAGAVVVVTATLVFAGAATCRDCVRANLGSGAPVAGHEVTVGSLIALLAQRLCLDQAEPLGVISLVDGVPRAEQPVHCPAHR